MTNVLYGNGQSNQLNARANKSQLYGLQGNDTLTSDGSDTFELNDSATQTLSAVIEDLNPSEDKIVVNFDGNTAPQLTSSISGSDVVWRDGKYNFPGENLNGSATSHEQIISDWMNSTTHRANILNTTYKKLGVGYNYYDIDKSDQRYYWTQLFADRLTTSETVTTANLLTANPAVYTVSKFITLTEDDDIRSNSEYGATIAALGGNDSISNSGLIVSISGGNDNDTVDNRASFATINAGTGNDSINLAAQEVLIQYASGDGNDTISGFNATDTLSITGDEYTSATVGNNIVVAVGDGSINLASVANLASVNIDGTRSKVFILTEGDDTLKNTIEAATIAALGGKDFIDNHGDNVSINGGAGDDSIDNIDSSVTIDGGIGNDFIDNLLGNSSKINGGDDNDTIHNSNSEYVTIDGGAGNDLINLSSYSQSNLIQYNVGDGNDTIWGLSEDSSLRIGDGTETYSTVVSGGDVIINVSTGSIRLVDARDKPPHVIIGESGLSGGSSNSNSNSNSNSSSSGRGDGGGRTSGGTSSNEGSGSDASGGRSASGSAGSQTSSGISGGGRVSTNRKNASSSAASRNLYNEMTSTQQTTNQLLTPTSKLQTVYVGGNQVISNYQSGDKIIFGAQYTGAFYDGAGNFFAGSSTGALVVENALDKVIYLSDAAGNDFVKAYAATTAGVIDGRGIAGFELINGSSGADWIYAGDGGSQLWGGADVASDILVGGNGADVFIGGRTQGSDLIVNASSADTVHLNDASLSDIIATEENNGVVAVAFNTGNVVAVQSSELLSASFMLADDSSYRYNHAAKNWQTA